MSWCPNCGSALSTDATKCVRCGAVFGADAAWQPTSTPPTSEFARPFGLSPRAEAMVGLVFVLGALPLILAGALIGGAGTAVNILLSMVLPLSGSGDGWIYGGL